MDSEQSNVDNSNEMDFSEGFNLGEEADEQSSPQEQEVDIEGADGTTQDIEKEETEIEAQEPVSVPPSAPAVQSVPDYQEPYLPRHTEHEAEQPKRIEIPEELKAEFDALKAQNPEAAELAMEDSPDGEAVRARLAQWGADIAGDRAAQTLHRRELANQTANAERKRQAEATRAYNQHFHSTLTREVPEFVALMNSPERHAEAMQYHQQIMTWIGTKPYTEAAPLMEIARAGKDPAQVAALIKQFESEKQKKARAVMPDPAGAFAVPTRGTPAAPAGIGDKDDFDAGWNATPSK